MKFLKSKTLWFSFLLTVFGAVQASWGLVDDFLSPRAAGFGALAIGIAIAVLRFLTTQPLDEK